MNIPKRYHPLLVTAHWLTVILLFGAGMLSESGRRAPINVHMIIGSVLLVVMLVRVIVRFTTKHPVWVDTGNKFLNQLGGLFHSGLYLFVFYILGMGALIANNRDLFAYVMGTITTVSRSAGIFGGFHQLGWALVLLLVFAHVVAALYHPLILKANWLARMWYSKLATNRDGETPVPLFLIMSIIPSITEVCRFHLRSESCTIHEIILQAGAHET